MGTYYAIFMMWIIMFVIIFPQNRKNKINRYVAMRITKNKAKERVKMIEIAKQFIGKECDITTILSSGATTTGIVKEIVGNSILVESIYGNHPIKACNLDFVVEITEVKRKAPKNKHSSI